MVGFIVSFFTISQVSELYFHVGNMQQPVLAGKSGKTPTGFIQSLRLLMMTQSISQDRRSYREPKLVSEFSELISFCAVSSAEPDTALWNNEERFIEYQIGRGPQGSRNPTFHAKNTV